MSFFTNFELFWRKNRFSHCGKNFGFKAEVTLFTMFHFLTTTPSIVLKWIFLARLIRLFPHYLILIYLLISIKNSGLEYLDSKPLLQKWCMLRGMAWWCLWPNAIYFIFRRKSWLYNYKCEKKPRIFLKVFYLFWKKIPQYLGLKMKPMCRQRFTY